MRVGGTGLRGGRPAYDEVAVARRREIILEAAIKLLPRLGSNGVRLKDIAAAARVSVGTLQHYFETRDEIVREAFAYHARQVVTGMRAEVDPALPAWEQVTRLLSRFARIAEFQQRAVLWIEFAAGAARDPRLRLLMGQTYDEWRVLLGDAVSAGIDGGAFHPPINADAAVIALCALLDGYEMANAIGVWTEGTDATEHALLAVAAAVLGYRAPEADRQ